MARDEQYHVSEGLDVVTPVSALALRVVSVLNAKQAGLRRGEARPHISHMLNKRITSRAGFDAADALIELRGFHLSDDAIIGTYIPAAARHVGQCWVDNEMGFAEVTIASVRLQSLLTEVAYVNPSSINVAPNTNRFLIVTFENDQHTLGAFVAAAQLRRRGAMVEVSCGEPEPDLRRQTACSQFDAVLFSMSCDGALVSAARMIRHIRGHNNSSPLFVAGGIVLNSQADIQHRTGADLATNDLDTVVAYCEQRSRTVELMQAQSLAFR